MEIGPKAVVLCGRCQKSQKKHAARVPVGEAGKEGGIEKRWGGGKVVPKEGVPCGRCRKKSKKHAAITPMAEEGQERAHHRATEQHTDLHFYPVKLQFVKQKMLKNA